MTKHTAKPLRLVFLQTCGRFDRTHNTMPIAGFASRTLLLHGCLEELLCIQKSNSLPALS